MTTMMTKLRWRFGLLAMAVLALANTVPGHANQDPGFDHFMRMLSRVSGPKTVDSRMHRLNHI